MIRYARAAYIDLRLLATGKRDRRLPPLRLRFVGAGDFETVGEHLLNLTRTRAAITPASRILDVGCGSGRLALPLTRYLESGSYEGFDVVAAAIRWCRKNITPRHPNFRFHHVALRNSDYSIRGSDASTFRFPFDNEQFDCVVAYSVFTHLQFDEMQNYIRESYRVLVPGGRFVATFFLLNEKSRAAQSRPGIQQFPFQRGSVRIASESNPAFAVAIDEVVLVDLLRQSGFRTVTIEPGGWYGEPGWVEFQDLVTCEK